MASDKALALHKEIEIFSTRKLSQERLKPWTEMEKGLYLTGSPDEHGELKATSPGFPKVDAYLGVNEKAPVYVDDKASKAGVKASLWMPIHDRPPFPGVEWLDMCVNFVIFCRDKGWSVIVHCVAGMSRSAMVMIAVYMKKDGLSVEKAAAKVIAKRPVNPDPSFIDGLYEYETYLKKSV